VVQRLGNGDPTQSIGELLMNYSANLPWHPPSAQRCVDAVDVNGLCHSLSSLGDEAHNVFWEAHSNARPLFHKGHQRRALWT